MTPRVSVLVGAYNNAATVGRAIEAVLAQSLRDLELIVVDDGSTDDTPAVVGSFSDSRLRYLPLERNVGIASSLNAGLEAARAPLVAVNDADDWSSPWRMERQASFLEGRPDVAVVGSRMEEVDEDGRSLRPLTTFAAGDVRRVLMRFNPIPNTSAMFRRAAALDIGGYDPRYRYAAEYDLWLRIAERSGVWGLDEVLSTRVMSGSNVGATRERAQLRETVLIRGRALRRRRTLRGVGGLVAPAVSFCVPLGAKRAVRRRRGQAG